MQLPFLEQPPYVILMFDIMRRLGYCIALLWNIHHNTWIDELMKVMHDALTGSLTAVTCHLAVGDAQFCVADMSMI
jgi:hypothetical protein